VTAIRDISRGFNVLLIPSGVILSGCVFDEKCLTYRGLQIIVTTSSVAPVSPPASFGA